LKQTKRIVNNEECVYETAIGGLKENFSIIIIPEAIAGKIRKVEMKSLKICKQKGRL